MERRKVKNDENGKPANRIRVRVSVYLFHFTNEQFFFLPCCFDPCCLGVLFWVLVMPSKKMIANIFERLETSPPHKIILRVWKKVFVAKHYQSMQQILLCVFKFL